MLGRRTILALLILATPGACGAARGGSAPLQGANVLQDSLVAAPHEAPSRPVPAELQPVPFDSATTARYHATATKLAEAIATDDAVVFRALHTDPGWAQADDWWKAMLADQKKGYGRIVRVVGPLRGVIRMGTTGVGVPRDGAAILLRFERTLGASMSFVLDESGKIVKSSLWVQRELASADPEGAELLWEAPKKGVQR